MRTMRNWAGLGVALMSLAAAPVAWSYTLSFSGDLTGAPGTVVSVDVAVDDGAELLASTFTVNYNPTILGFEPGASGPGALNPTWRFDAFGPAGAVNVAIFGIDPLPPGGGTIASLGFTVLGEAGAVSPLGLSEVLLETDAGAVAESEVTLEEGSFAAVPVPAAGVLFGLGLMSLGWLGRRKAAVR